MIKTKETGFELWLDDPFGNRLTVIEQVVNINALRVAEAPAPLILTLPDTYDDYLKEDRIVEVWHKPMASRMRLWNAYRIRDWKQQHAKGAEITTIEGIDANELLDTRVVAYPANSAQASMTDYADDMLKAIVTDNLGSDAPAGRNLSAYGLTVAPDLSAAPEITRAFAWQDLRMVCQEIAEASRQAGTRLYYGFASIFSNTLGFQFRTWTGQPGRDRTGVDSVTFGLEWGNLENPVFQRSTRNEKNYFYVGGKGNEGEREIEEVYDTARIGISPWNRREDFTNASGQHSTTEGYQAVGQARLSEYRPKEHLSGKLVDGEAIVFGRDWDWGDKVNITYRKRQYKAVITAIALALDSKGLTTTDGQFEVVDG